MIIYTNYPKLIILIILIMRGLGIGDWGLGQSPIPNPQSPITKYSY